MKRLIFVLFLMVFSVTVFARPYIYISDNSLKKISVFDTATSKVVGAIKLPSAAKGLKMDYDFKRLYFVCPATNALYRAFTKNFTVDSNYVKVGFEPVDLALTEDGKKVYVVNKGTQNVSIVGLPGMDISKDPIMLPAPPVAIAIHEDYRRAYVPMEGRNGVAIIDMRKDKVIYTIPTGIDPYGMVIYKNKLYISNEGVGSVSVINLKTSKVEQEIVTSESPRGLAVVNNNLYVAVKNGIDVFETDRYGKPAAIGLDYDAFHSLHVTTHRGDRVYISGHGPTGGKIAIADPGIHEILSEVSIQGWPMNLASRASKRTPTPSYTPTKTKEPTKTPTMKPTPQPTKTPKPRPKPKKRVIKSKPKPKPTVDWRLHSNLGGKVIMGRRPVSGVQVKALNSHTNKVKVVKTDANGRFYFKALPIGGYIISVKATYLKQKSVETTVNRGKNAELLIKVKKR